MEETRKPFWKTCDLTERDRLNQGRFVWWSLAWAIAWVVASITIKHDPDALIVPHFEFWQEPVVAAGDTVKRKQLLARGVTHVYFQANVWILTHTCG